MATKAKFKLVHDKYQLVCSKCNKVIKYSKQFTDEDWKAQRGEIKMDPQYCLECEEIMKYK